MTRFAPIQRHAGSGAERRGAPAFIIGNTSRGGTFDLRDAREDFVLSFCLTPARWQANKLAAAWSVQRRVRGRFWPEPRENRHRTIKLLKLQANAVPVLGSGAGASRDVRGPVRARMRGGARVGMGDYIRTTEPMDITHIYHEVSGSKAVLERFWSEPGSSIKHDNGGFPPFLNIIGGRYGRVALKCRSQGLVGGDARQKFWGSAARIGCAPSELRGRTGMAEIRRFSTAWRSALERLCWNDANKALILHDKGGLGVSLSGLAARPGGSIGQIEGGGPPSPRALVPSTFAHAIFRISADPAADEPVRFVRPEKIGKNPRTGTIQYGSGCKAWLLRPRGAAVAGLRNEVRQLRVGEKPWSVSPSISNGIRTLSGRFSRVK